MVSSAFVRTVFTIISALFIHLLQRNAQCELAVWIDVCALFFQRVDHLFWHISFIVFC